MQIEVSPSASSFEKLDYAIQAMQCTRYYIALSGVAGGYYVSGAGAVLNGPFSFPTVMRGAPSATVSATGGGNYSSVVVNSSTTSSVTFGVITLGAGNFAFNYVITASADL